MDFILENWKPILGVVAILIVCMAISGKSEEKEKLASDDIEDVDDIEDADDIDYLDEESSEKDHHKEQLLSEIEITRQDLANEYSKEKARLKALGEENVEELGLNTHLLKIKVELDKLQIQKDEIELELAQQELDKIDAKRQMAVEAYENAKDEWEKKKERYYGEVYSSKNKRRFMNEMYDAENKKNKLNEICEKLKEERPKKFYGILNFKDKLEDKRLDLIDTEIALQKAENTRRFYTCKQCNKEDGRRKISREWLNVVSVGRKLEESDTMSKKEERQKTVRKHRIKIKHIYKCQFCNDQTEEITENVYEGNFWTCEQCGKDDVIKELDTIELDRYQGYQKVWETTARGDQKSVQVKVTKLREKTNYECVNCGYKFSSVNTRALL